MSTPASTSRVRRALFTDQPRKKMRTTKATVARTVASMAETKFQAIDGPWLTGTVTSTGANIAPCVIGPGTTVSSRVGNKVTLTRLIANFSAKNCGTLRVIVYCPKDPATLLSASATQEDSIDITKHWVLHDEFYTLGNFTNTSVNINLPLRHRVFWDGNGGSDFIKNPLYVFINKSENGTTSEINGWVRVFYKDI